MKENFWQQLKKPIIVLAPMANVTDAAFRSIIARYGKPDVMWTEFVSVDGLLSDGKNKLLVDLKYQEAERPIVAQIFGAVPGHFEKIAKMLVEMGFDGIDINMGCPDKSVLRQEAGGGCIRNPKLALEIIEATKRGAGDLPVSVKTRLGYSKPDFEWLATIFGAKLAAVTVHLRTVKEMSKVPAHWELMPEIREIRDQLSDFRPILLGNGDVMTLAEAEQKVVETGCDGVMIGRGIFGNPWCFDKSVPIISISRRLQAMLEHTKLFEQEFTGIKNFEVMKKHFKAYVNGFDGAKELRTRLMEGENYAEVEKIVQEHYPILKENSLV
jgi:nifR3 family TIM-barrel protein